MQKKVGFFIDYGFLLHKKNQLRNTPWPDPKQGEQSKSNSGHNYFDIYETGLVRYCWRHIGKNEELFRIYVYDCPPLSKSVHNPLTGRDFNLKKTPGFNERAEAHARLRRTKHVALRMGTYSKKSTTYKLKASTLKDLFKNQLSWSDLTSNRRSPRTRYYSKTS